MDENLELVVRAADFAARRHRDQRRKNGDIPYVNHPLAVARRLVECGGVDDPVTIAAALLHDTIEDTATSHEEIEAAFGSEVATVVGEVSDDRTLAKAERKREQIRHAREISDRARAVKLADKLDNLEDLASAPPKSWNAERIRGYFVWAHAVVDNLRGANAALERALDELFASELRVGNIAFRAVPEKAADRDARLTTYLAAMARTDD